jgi:iron-sulfur cluster assembly protein
MLTLTPSAIQVVHAMVEASGQADNAGLRIATTDAPETEALEVEFVTGPDVDDQVLDEHGARVFLEPRAAMYLEDKVLHGEVDDEGRVRFGLSPQNDART